ncbi:hypothetical protein [Solwaraspora sp. WMMA2065]|uniref:hypothetical protein n=1 Tax=Solwaraspora sp. WMMA2065 TaxID=3015166 RepID=UPI00259BA0A4|nr:hypothetical protein [Solwaraspora sp. WMMA2065]WJK33051.1 hypothetical protein O7610_20310 [Solwaraspora sp. WMMA2065]
MHDTTTRALWFAIGLLAAIIVGAAAGLLSWLDGRSVPGSILIAGAGCSGAFFLFIAAAHFVTSRPER